MINSRLRLLEAIQDVQARFIGAAPRSEVFAGILTQALELTSSGYGFVGELFHTEDGEPHVRAIAVTDRLWDPGSRYARILQTGECEWSHAVAPDAQSRLPGAPSVQSFLGIPLYHRDEMVGVLAVANGTEGYDQGLIDELEPFSVACAGILIASRVAADQRDSEAALRESDTRFRQLAENIHEVFWLTELAPLRVIYVSPAYRAIWGRSPEDLYANPDSWIEGIHPDDREEVSAAFASVGTLGAYDEEYRVVRPDGTVRWIHDRGFPFRSESDALDASGDAAQSGRIAGIAEDITDRKRLESTVRKTEQRLRHSQRIEALGRVAGGVAHDFNNLLTVINGNAGKLLERSEGEIEQRVLRQVVQAGDRAAGLTRQLLAFSRKQVLELTVIDIRDLFANLAELLPPILGGRIVLDLSAEPTALLVEADMHQLVQVVMNLAVNARDAMPAGGRVRIESRLGSGDAEFVELVVVDGGAGIAQRDLPYIFDPFFTTKDEGEGSGLGLSTVFGIVTQLGGSVDVETAPDEGTTFLIRLPRVDAPAATEPVDRRATDGAAAIDGSPLPSRLLSILLVDDEPLVRSYVASTLADHGHIVIEAASGDAALAAVAGREAELDLLITDMVMPGMGGRETAHELRARNSGVAVLYMSGYTAECAAEFGLATDGADFLPKPFVVEDLLRKIAELTAAV